VRFAALQTVLLARYDFRQSVSHASFVTSRSIIRLVASVRSRWRATADNAPGICSAGMPRVRLSPGKLPDLPSSHETLAPAPTPLSEPARTCAPLYDPGRIGSPHQCGFPMLSTNLQHRGLRQCVNFVAQSRGPVLAVYASCRRCLRLRKTRLRLGVSLCRPRFHGVGSLRMVSPIVYLSIRSSFMGFAWRDEWMTLPLCSHSVNYFLRCDPVVALPFRPNQPRNTSRL
jgi:hypothetical protein